MKHIDEFHLMGLIIILNNLRIFEVSLLFDWWLIVSNMLYYFVCDKNLYDQVYINPSNKKRDKSFLTNDS